MTFLVALCLAFLAPPTELQSQRFQVTAPSYLTLATAEVNLLAASAAGFIYHEDPALLLAIAYHESRYIASTRTPEAGQRESCGVMTPYPKARCTPSELTLIGGYAAGAAHLAMWRHLSGHRALLAYAGGGYLVRLCVRQPDANTCKIEATIQARARLIRAIL